MRRSLNILYLHCHDAGRYIQPYGYALETPNLQCLAEEGILFRQAHCGNPTCSPSRACLLTGQAAHSAGMFGLAHRGWTLNDYGQTMMSVLQGHGYHTVLCGQQHLANPPYAKPAEAGYSEVLRAKGTLDQPASAAEDFLEREMQAPFFLDVGFFAPHRTEDGSFPRSVSLPDERYVMPPSTLPDAPETRRDYALYAASVQSMDHAMGRVLRALEQSGHRENTLVICTTDHGIAFPSMKCRLTDHGTGVMLLMRGPSGFTGGKVVDSLVSHIDLFPTVCELIGIENPSWLQGKSLVHLVQGSTKDERDAVFAEVNYHAAEEPMRSVRTKRWKYIRRFAKQKTTVLPNIDAGLSKLMLYDSGLADKEQPAELLFDLYHDPQEMNNLAAEPGHIGICKEMADRLAQWMRETDDPLLNGELPVSDGMILTDADAYASGGCCEDEREKLPWNHHLRQNSVYYRANADDSIENAGDKAGRRVG